MGEVLVAADQLRVPLHAESEPAGKLDGFDDLVERDRAHLCTTGILDRLVMRGVHLDVTRADDGREQGAGDDFHRVAGLARIVTLLVVETAGNFVGDVLVEHPAGFDGEQLHAAADAEHGNVGSQGCPQQALLERGPPRLERPHPRAGSCAVELGGNVECAARDHEAVAETQRFLHRRRIVRIRQHHWKPTCRDRASDHPTRPASRLRVTATTIGPL